MSVLVDLLAADTGEIAAELAAVVLRNLALGNAANRAAIIAAGGVQPLLSLLSMGQDKLVHPMPCEVCPFWTPSILVAGDTEKLVARLQG